MKKTLDFLAALILCCTVGALSGIAASILFILLSLKPKVLIGFVVLPIVVWSTLRVAESDYFKG